MLNSGSIFKGEPVRFLGSHSVVTVPRRGGSAWDGVDEEMIKVENDKVRGKLFANESAFSRNESS